MTTDATTARFRVGDRLRVLSLPAASPPIKLAKPSFKVGDLVTCEAVAPDGQVRVVPNGRFYHPSRFTRA